MRHLDEQVLYKDEEIAPKSLLHRALLFLLLLTGCAESHTAIFEGVHYVSCQESHTIKNPDCFNSIPQNRFAKEASCNKHPTVATCTTWLVVGGVSNCGADLNCRPSGSNYDKK